MSNDPPSPPLRFSQSSSGTPRKKHISSSNIKPLMAYWGLMLALAVLVPDRADAVVVNVGGTDYQVTTITTSFDTNAALFMSQPWWGDFDASMTFATAVGSSLGFPHLVPAPGGPGGGGGFKGEDPILLKLSTFRLLRRM